MPAAGHGRYRCGGMPCSGCSNRASPTAPWTLALSLVFCGQRISRRAAAGVTVATTGVAIVTAVHATLAIGAGDALVLTGSLAASGSVLVASRLADRADSLELTAYQFGFGLAWIAPVSMVLYLTRSTPTPTGHDLRYLIGAATLGLGAFSLAYLLYNYAVGEVPVDVAGIALNLIPLFGVAAAYTMLHERLYTSQLLGGLLILAGVIVFSTRTESSLTPEAPSQ